MHWHSISIEEALKETGSSEQGLSHDAAKENLAKYGRNELIAKKKKSPVIIFLRQFFDVMILVLALAAIISILVAEYSDAFVIIVIIILNATVGFVQEYRAEKAMEALQKMAVPMTAVWRDNKRMEIPSPEIVPGDIVLLHAGNMVPADIRLMEVHSLKADEASLTGESHATDKTINTIDAKDIPPGDQINMVFKGTVITNGRGKGVAIATGMKTELGKIAGMLQEKESATPLQKRMADFSKKLTVNIIVICAVIFGAGLLRGEDATKMLLTAISVAVAAIPEALPAVITISLAVGAKRLIKENVLVKKLHAVETLGSVTYICSDKTGTLTKNQMTVKDIWSPDKKGTKELIMAMSLNHDVKKSGDNDELTGDPTEVAMLNYARHNEQYEKSWKAEYPREDELPFDAERKAMSTIHLVNDKFRVITKGALESVAAMCANADDKKWKEQEEKMAQQGMRVIAFATKEINELPKEITPEFIEKNLEFLGLAGLIDPPREEAREAIKECKTAGIITVMITGDHPLTAAAIARELGILENKEQKVMTGIQLSEMPDEEFQNEVEQIRVYARVSPEQKLNIVKALQQKGHFVAMTGDGVNDAPSLRRANIGIAMGITGTDVTK
jgi:Ca2+-transporting ATPase